MPRRGTLMVFRAVNSEAERQTEGRSEYFMSQQVPEAT
jgi:hypothetical protein